MAGHKDSRAANGAAGKKDILLFDPDDLVLVEDVASAIYDERVKMEVDERLVLSIMVRGVIVPIVVRKNPETGKTEVVDGRQRTKACREANKRLKKEGRDSVRIPAVVKRSDAAESLALMVTTNDLRTDDTPLNRARKAARYLDLGGTEEDACVMLGISKASLKNMLSLLDAPAVVRRAVESGAVTTSDGYKLAKLEPEEAAKKVAELKEHAPRTPGKKRSSNAKKAREIVDGGKKRRKRAVSVDTDGSEANGIARGEAEIAKRRAWVADHLKIPGQDKKSMEQVFAWLGGDDGAFEEWETEAAQ